MLHIVLLILKIILIAIAVVLGIILFALLTVLFVPIRYKVSAQYNDNVKFASAKCSWLLHILSLSAGYDKDSGVHFDIKLFGKKLNRDKKEKSSDNSNDKKKNKKEKSVFDEEESRVDLNEKAAQAKPETETKNVEEAVEADGHKQADAEVGSSGGQRSTEAENRAYVSEQKNTESDAAKEKKKPTLPDRIKNIAGKLRDLKENAQEKKEKVSAALHNEEYKALVLFLWSQVKELFWLLKPKKGRLYVHYGFDDVETTGKVTMYVAVLYGLIGADVNILPDFENKVFEGDAYIKGGIRLFWIGVIALRCYFNKEFKKYILNK